MLWRRRRRRGSAADRTETNGRRIKGGGCGFAATVQELELTLRSNVDLRFLQGRPVLREKHYNYDREKSLKQKPDGRNCCNASRDVSPSKQ